MADKPYPVTDRIEFDDDAPIARPRIEVEIESEEILVRIKTDSQTAVWFRRAAKSLLVVAVLWLFSVLWMLVAWTWPKLSVWP